LGGVLFGSLDVFDQCVLFIVRRCTD